MSTKYHRDTAVREGIEGRRTPWMRQAPQNTLSRRQRIFIALMGLAIIALLGQIAYRLNSQMSDGLERIQRGVATIVAIGAPGSSAITVEVQVSAENVLQATWSPIPSPYWEALALGDRVAVLYQVEEKGTSLQLIECGMLALPDQNL